MRPTLVFLPGTLCDARVWRPVADALCTDFPCAAPEYGDQDSIAAMAGAMLARCAGPLVPVGLSMGGIVALEMWRQAPQRIVGLGLWSTNPGADTAQRKEARALQLAAAATDGMHALGAQRLAPAYFAARGAALAHLAQTVAAMAHDAGIARFAAQSAALSTRSDSWPTLPSITVPVLVAYGTRDTVCPPPDQRRMAALLPRVSLHAVAGAGHLAPLEQAAGSAALLRAWLGQTGILAARQP
jgi:pimeloyl-ACP methyl ester carboxylesterase